MKDTKDIARGIGWKLLERFGVQIVQFVLQIILARMLDVAHYGTLSLMIIFTTLANVFVQNGFNTSLVQNKDVKEEDYSSVFWVVLMIAGVLYALLYNTAPLISRFFDMPDLVSPFRVLALVILPGAFNSVQLAKVSRELDFKKVFRSNICGIAVSGAVGIYMAYRGAGLWALVAQNLLNTLIACVVMFFTVKWRPRLVCNMKRVKVLFSFGWKLMASSALDTVYQDIRSLVIGKKYTSDTLGHYNRGKQFPQFIIYAINGAVQSVMLPTLSAEQDNVGHMKQLARKSIMISAYFIFPMMAGLAVVAEPLTLLLLTEKWLPCVPYMQIYCFTLAFYPVHTCNLQAINAMGRSDINLILEILKKSIGIITLIIALVFFDSPIAIALVGAVTTVTSSFINAFPNKRLINYSYFEQIRDLLPSIFASLVMCACAFAVGRIPMSAPVQLVVQVVTGVIVYILMSVLLRLEPYRMVIAIIKKLRKK